MDGLRSPRLVLFLAPVLFLGCDLPTSSESLVEIGDGVPLAAVDCEARPEHPKCPDGGGGSPGETVSVSYSGGISGGGDAVVKTDNSSTLELNEARYSSTFDFTINEVDCVTKGVFGEDGKLTHSELLAYLSSGTIERKLSLLVIDKTTEESDRHNLRHEWPGPSGTGTVVSWIGDPTFDRKSPAPEGSTSPLVELTGTDEYTFRAGHGIIEIKQLYKRPKDHPIIVCPLLDDVVVTVGS